MGGLVASAAEDVVSETTTSNGRRRFRRDLVSKALGHLATERRAVLGLAALAVVVAQAESAALVLIALIADAAARGATSAGFTMGPIDLSLSIPVAAILAALSIIVAALVVFAYRYLLARTSARLERNSRDKIVSSFAGADWEYQSTIKPSRLHGRLLSLMKAPAEAFTGLVGWIRALAAIVVFVTVAAIMSLLAAVAMVVFGAILSLAVLPVRRKVAKISAQSGREELGLAADVAEAADHGPDVQVFGAWPAFLNRFDKRSGSLQRWRERLGLAKGLIPVVYQYGALTLILLVLLIATAAQASGELGQFVASALLLLRSVQYGQQLQQSLEKLAEAVPRIELLKREVTVPPPRVVPGEGVLNGIEILELRNVCYEYPGSEKPALNNVSIDLRPGTIVGVAGPSGSGKSTLAQILLRLRWPTSGQYYVNGQLAETYSVRSWNRLVSHVPQTPRLLHGSLAENVSFLDESISREQVDAALRAVGLEELVKSLPGGLEAPVGPTGRGLSGGQIQRLGIARALVREPRVIVLDEPTSALDIDAEKIVGEALNAMRGRPDVLVIVIAHRPSTLALCDEMVVLQEGRVVGAGRSEDVALNSEFMARTWGIEWKMQPRGLTVE